ncbi:MAG: Wzz/FepE/Etk N-terminal domain-containing protein, partial [Halanaerobiales bacterium]
MEEDKFYEEYEIDLREYVLLLWEQKWIIIGLFLIAVTAAALISQFMITPVYETEATIHAPSFELINGEEFSQSDYLSFMNENELRGDVIEEFDLREENENFTVDNLRDKLTISPEDNS